MGHDPYAEHLTPSNPQVVASNIRTTVGVHRPICTRSTAHLLLLAFFFFLIRTSLAQNTIHIPADQPTIQAGINAANNGDTVLVAPGTYYENIDFKGKAITVSSSGGAASTIIDGGSNTGMAVVAFKSQEVRTSVLSGFTIQHGGTQTSTSQASGGVYVHAAAPTIQNNIVAANRCSGIFANGGVLIQGNTVTGTLYQNSPTLDLDPYCQQGGTGIVVEGTVTVGPYIRVEVIGNTITNNTQALGAGGIEIEAAENTLIQNNIISNNTGTVAGGIGTTNTQAVYIIQNLIYANTAGGGSNGTAGGIAISSPQYGSTTSSLALIAQNTLGGNTLMTGASGESAAELNLSGAVYEYVVANNIFAGGTSAVPAVNCSVAYNYLNTTPVVIDHNDIYNSQGPAYGGACPDQTGTYGNISADPRFNIPASFDFHLLIASPAIDEGNNSVFQMPAADLDGNPRFQDATGKGYPTVDMGAYEYPGLQDANVTFLTINPNDPIYGSGVAVITAVLNSPAGRPTGGSVTFFEDGKPFVTEPVQSSAVVSGATGNQVPGLHTFLATYSGSGNFEPAVSVKLYVLVGQYQCILNLTSSLNPSNFGQSVTFNASTIRISDTPIAGPSGSITFSDGSSLLATVTLAPDSASSSSAAFSTSNLSAGTHEITASAHWDLNSCVGTNSANLSQLVIVPSSTISVSSSVSTTGEGQPVTLTSTVTGTSPTPTGSVSLYDGTTLLNTATLSPTGQTAYTTTSLAVGTHIITASYSGDTVYSTKTSAPIVVTITPPVTPPATPDFSFTLANPTLTIQTGQHLTTTVTLASINSFADTLALTCSNLRAHLTCTFTPNKATLTSNGTTTVSLTLDTAGPAASSSISRTSPLTLAFLLSPASFFLGIGALRRRRTPLRLLLLLFAILPMTLTLGGCGVVTIPTIPVLSSVAPGTYTIPITATGATTGLTHTIQLTLTVTP